jgi:acetoacetate decarboxylase
MPAMFGPSLLPDVSPVLGVKIVSISFDTDRDAIAAILPRFFEAPETPVATLSYINYPSLEYLGGRGYQELVVSLSATYRDDAGVLNAGFAPVMWVDQVGALISGREFMGYGKLLGNFECHSHDDRISFACREYDTVLIDGEASELVEVSDDGLQRINRGAANVSTFGWKYIAGAGGAPADVDYPLVNMMHWNYKRAWSGKGRLNFHQPTFQQAPLSARAVAALAQLPVHAWRRVFVAEGDGQIDRVATRRLGSVKVNA